MTDLMQDTAKSVKELKENSGNPGDYCWPFNGLKPNGELFSMGPAEFVSWASAMHPEYVDEDTGMPLLHDFVFTQLDEECTGIENLAGTVMVTILPSVDNIISYAHNADYASRHSYRANPKVAARFFELAKLFNEKSL